MRFRNPIIVWLLWLLIILLLSIVMGLKGKLGLAAIPYASQSNGFFSKMARGGVNKLDDKTCNLYGNAKNIDSFSRVSKLASELGVSEAAVALAYLTSQPFPTFPIIGCRTVPQLNDSLTAGELVLTAQQLSYLANSQPGNSHFYG